MVTGLSRPEYTGENRCRACTVTNTVLLAVATVAVAVRSRPAALVLLVAGGTALWLRGYLIPFTPRFAPRVVAALPVVDRWFRTDDPAGELGTAVDVTDERRAAIVEALLEEGVLRASGAELDLDERFREAWWREMRSIRADDDAALAAALRDRIPWAEAVEVRPDGDAPVVRIVGSGTGARSESWLARPAAVASLAVIRVLEDRGTLAPEDRVLAADPMRLFVDRCPTCETTLEERPAGSCCGGVLHDDGDPYTVRVCADCGAEIATLD